MDNDPQLESMRKHLINTELKRVATAAGIIDPDGALLAPREALKLTDTYQVLNAAHAIDELKRSKPYLFRAAPNSASPKTEVESVGHLKPGSPEALAAIAKFNSKYQSW